jgi:hypothetical protein
MTEVQTSLSLLRSAAGALKEYRTRTASLLWDLSDQSMVDVDRDLRFELIRNKAKDLSPRLQETVNKNPNYQALALCYKAARETDQSTAIGMTEAALDLANFRHLRALALSMLASYLAQRNREHLQQGNASDALKDESLCRTISGTGLSEYASELWYPALSWSLHAALGSLDRWAEDATGAKLHFTKAIDEFQKLDTRLKNNERDNLGILHIEFGDVYRLSKNLDAAEREYEAAISILQGVSKVTALSRLVAVIVVRGVQPERGRKLAQKAMKLARELNMEFGLIDELEGNLAYLNWNLGARGTAIQAYEHLDREGVHPKIRHGAREFLAGLRSPKQARRTDNESDPGVKENSGSNDVP